MALLVATSKPRQTALLIATQDLGVHLFMIPPPWSLACRRHAFQADTVPTYTHWAYLSDLVVATLHIRLRLKLRGLPDEGPSTLAGRMLISATTVGSGARHQRFPDGTRFVYQLHAESGERYEWDSTTMAKLNDYSLLDPSI